MAISMTTPTAERAKFLRPGSPSWVVLTADQRARQAAVRKKILTPEPQLPGAFDAAGNAAAVARVPGSMPALQDRPFTKAEVDSVRPLASGAVEIDQAKQRAIQAGTDLDMAGIEAQDEQDRQALDAQVAEIERAGAAQRAQETADFNAILETGQREPAAQEAARQAKLNAAPGGAAAGGLRANPSFQAAARQALMPEPVYTPGFQAGAAQRIGDETKRAAAIHATGGGLQEYGPKGYRETRSIGAPLPIDPATGRPVEDYPMMTRRITREAAVAQLAAGKAKSEAGTAESQASAKAAAARGALAPETAATELAQRKATVFETEARGKAQAMIPDLVKQVPAHQALAVLGGMDPLARAGVLFTIADKLQDTHPNAAAMFRQWALQGVSPGAVLPQEDAGIFAQLWEWWVQNVGATLVRAVGLTPAAGR